MPGRHLTSFSPCLSIHALWGRTTKNPHSSTKITPTEREGTHQNAAVEPLQYYISIICVLLRETSISLIGCNGQVSRTKLAAVLGVDKVILYVSAFIHQRAAHFFIFLLYALMHTKTSEPFPTQERTKACLFFLPNAYCVLCVSGILSASPHTCVLRRWC